jgi:ssDNA-binding Zn-finger/Zn-ribbon topoisomerase 1
MERQHKIEQVTCPDCGLHMEVHLKESRFENVLTETVSKCHYERGSAVLSCPVLKLEILEAHRSLRKL